MLTQRLCKNIILRFLKFLKIHTGNVGGIDSFFLSERCDYRTCNAFFVKHPVYIRSVYISRMRTVLFHAVPFNKIFDICHRLCTGLQGRDSHMDLIPRKLSAAEILQDAPDPSERSGHTRSRLCFLEYRIHRKQAHTFHGSP